MAPEGSMEWYASGKVSNIRSRDKAQCGYACLSTEDAVELAKASNGRCTLCDCKLIFEHYRARCLFQWSLDRIDRNVPHSKENVRVTCLNCNLSGPRARKLPCNAGCHPGDIPWGSAPCPSPDPVDVPCPSWGCRMLEEGSNKRRRLKPSSEVMAG